MFCVERQHRRVRPQAELVKNAGIWERSVLFRVLDAQVCSLQGAGVLEEAYRLLGKQVRADFVGLVSKSCRCGGIRFHRNDVVIDRRGRAAVVLECILTDDGRLLVRVEVMRSAGGYDWTQTQLQECWRARGAILPVAWFRRGDITLAVIQ